MFLPLLVPDPTPEATVRGFVDAFLAHDASAMARRVVGGRSTDLGERDPSAKVTLNLGTAKVDGDAATVESDLTPTYGPRSYHETVMLRRVEGDWKIVPGDVRTAVRMDENPISTLAAMTANPGLFARAKAAAKKTVDLSNVKQIALAVLMYAADHKDRLPPAKGFRAAVMPYLRDADVLTPPGAPKGTVGYFLDPRLSGMAMTSIARPAETAMILEGTPAKTAFPWSGRTPVGYVDGHARTVDGPTVLKARTIALK